MSYGNSRVIFHRVCQYQLLNGKLFVFEIHQTKKVTAQNNGRRSVTKKQRRCLSLQITKTDKAWETIIWYLVQCLSFTSVRTATEATVMCLVKNSAMLKMLLLNHKSALRPAAVCINQGLLKCSRSFDMFPHTLFSISGVFALLQAYAFLQYLKDRLTRQEFQTLFFLGVSFAAGMVFLTVIYLTYTGMPGPLLLLGSDFYYCNI